MLDGIRIIDFSFYLPGPFATMRLGDLGAEIIKVEPPYGDLARHMGSEKDRTDSVFLANNRNKKSITLNLKNPQAKKIARELIKTADVVIEGFRPGVAKRLGIDYESVKELKKAIVYCSISGYGQKGDRQLLGSHDINYMALSGALAQMKDSHGRPVHPTNTFADLVSSLGLNEAILSGLIKSQRTGVGSYFDISMTEVMSSFMINHLSLYKDRGVESGIPFLGGEIVSYQIYETKDQRYVALAALEEKFWKNFCLSVEREDWLKDHYSPAKEENPVFQDICELFSSRTLREWEEFGLKVDCCLTPVLETSELAIIDNKEEKAPQLGEHTEEIMRNELQASEEQLAEWKKADVF